MDIKDLKQLLLKTISDTESIYLTYANKLNETNERDKVLDLKEMNLQRDEAKLSVLIDKYKEVDSLETARLNAEAAEKSMEERSSALQKERAQFEQYKSIERAALDSRNNELVNLSNKVVQDRVNLNKAIEDFNATKKKYIMTEGEASF